MNTYLVLSTILVVAFACLLKETDGLKCYVCVSCNDPFDSTGVDTTDCNGSCAKLKVSDVVSRSCIDEKEGNACESQSQGGVTGHFCTCDSDLCNGGSAQRLSVMLSMMIFAVMVLKAMYW
ncbi:hypothetical protein ACF0H5_020568 [Mactra antiquata]